MTEPVNMALYRYLVAHGASEQEAEQAARIDASALATKADLADLKATLLMWMIGTILTAMGIQTAIIVGVLLRLGVR